MTLPLICSLWALFNGCRGVDAMPKWLYFSLVAFLSFWLYPSVVFAGFWLAYVLAMQVTGWGHGIAVVKRSPMLVDRTRSDYWIVRLVKGHKLLYWTIRSMYGYPVIIAMAVWYKQPWILAIGLLTQLIGPWGYMLSRISQWNNNWRMVEMGMGVVFAIMVSLTRMVI